MQRYFWTIVSFGLLLGETTVVGVSLRDVATDTYALDGSNQFFMGGVTIEQTSTEYLTNNTGGHGSVTISSYTSQRIAGTFEFAAHTNDGTDPAVVTDGRFDVPIIRSM